MEAFKDLLSKLWKTVWRVVFKELKENLWRFECSKGGDKKRVMEGRSWLFDQYLLCLINLMELLLCHI
jgi:hypothetical protein